MTIMLKSWDHPRGCGEHKRAMLSQTTTEGSSPRMRGAHDGRTGHIPPFGIIPADAGSTTIPCLSRRTCQDHPRGCGEHKQGHYAYYSNRGSSPRMRGALGWIVTGIMLVGIIPADAGSTIYWNGASSTSKDHPRGCGEHELNCIQPTKPTGSSPRMRGAR